MKKVVSNLDLSKFVPVYITPKKGENKKSNALYYKGRIVINSSRKKEVIINRNVTLTEEDFIAIGLYFAEGDKYINKDSKYNHSGEIAFVNNEIKCINVVINLLGKIGIKKRDLRWRVDLNIKHKINPKDIGRYWIAKLGLDIKKRRPKWIYRTGGVKSRLCKSSSIYGCLHIYYSSVILRSFFLNFINLLFDECIYKMRKKEISLILKGFFAGDGNVDYSERYNRKQVEFSNENPYLLGRIRKSLIILGLNSIRETWPEKTKSHNKGLRIYNKHDFDILDKYEIPYFVKYKKDTFKKIIKSY